ncbi:MAG: TonB-dependent receptor [Phenylobacterium sp.]|uniref:TonB-dependent receptor n=1 Tax=Phenylobacterium sp. TaxID=1871053 RepID=UPI0025D2B4A7|nr:TonB-dependent receptor [Phenylobacterium sp.]MCG9916450.1 TonB-dependent receptor [Phenylobacterium sp.]
MKRLAGGAALTALVCAMGSAVYAQETTSAIRGQVFTEAGAPVGNASVTVVHTPSNTRSVTGTNAQGVFDSRGLRVGGPYTITVSAPGFGERTQENVFLTLGETTRLSFDLFSQVAELVVTAAPGEDSTGVRRVLDETAIESVVSVTRDIRDLARRSALVTQNTRGDGGISIAGSNPRNNRITIDGAQAQDDFGLNTGGTPTRRGPISLDAVEQFTVDAVPVDVENGDFSGGALDVVLKSGENDFSGSVFLNYLNDGMVGRSIRGNNIGSQVSQTNWGAFLSGPIWQDRLFFAASYEIYETSDLTSTGPEGAGFANSVRGVNQAQIDQVTGIFNSNYASKFDVGTIARTKPVLDEKYSFKIDANLTDQHRLALTARYALSELVQRTNITTSSAGLDSQWYLTGEEDYSYTGELNSDWTDTFSTQLRVTLRDYERRQLPPSGQEFSHVQVCLAPTSGGSVTGCDLAGQANPSLLQFGPDQFRHANELATDNLTIQFKGEWALGDHLLKFGASSQRQDVANLFLPTQDGIYYFDSIADFAAGRANRLGYTDAIRGLTVADVTADLTYRLNSVFLQDTYDINPDLTVSAGIRYDWYTNDDPPPLNTNFLARNGFSNQKSYDGLSVMMPRFSVDWRASDRLKVRVGGGLFSGGVPDVLASNSYGGGAGFLTSGVVFERNADGTFRETTGAPGFTQAIGASALNVSRTDARTFYDIPADVRAFQGGASASPTTEVGAFAPGFKFPSEWKLFLNAQYELWDGWNLGLDVVTTQVRDGLYLRDTRSAPLVVNGVTQRTPDGRLRYDGIGGSAAQRAAAGITSQNLGSARDLVAYNTNKGRGLVAAVSLQKTFDFGLDVTGSYTYQDIDDFSSSFRFSSTQSSMYQTPVGQDPEQPAYGSSYEEIEHSFKFQASYARSFLWDLETRATLFAEKRSGRGTTFTMSDATGGRSPVFGVNRGSTHLLYVPDMSGNGGASGLDYGLVRFADTSTRDNFIRAVQQFGLPQNQIVPKGYFQNDDIHIVDLQLSQELPSYFAGHKFRVVLDMQNVLNMLNDEWGIVEEYTDVNSLVRVNCANAAGTAVATGDPSCARYRYSSFSADGLRENIDNNGKSVWAIQVGLRYEF